MRQHTPTATAHPTQANRVSDAGYGPAVGSSPFALRAPHRVPYYSSNSDLALGVDVLDYYGQVASGEWGLQALGGTLPRLSGCTRTSSVQEATIRPACW